MENRLTFGLDAAAYRRYRPAYPPSLYEYLAALAPNHECALDCATGNGQAAVDLARHFDRVCGFDSSRAQIEAAITHPRVEYRVAEAESLPYPARSFSLVTAAQAAHWFELSSFYREIRRVGKPGCLVAIWGYSYSQVDPEVDAIVDEALLRPIEPFWSRGNLVILERYQQIEFPFDEVGWPGFEASNTWSRDDYLRYLGTWSAVRKYAEASGNDPVAALDDRLSAVWPAGETRSVRFEFVGRAGRIA